MGFQPDHFYMYLSSEYTQSQLCPNTPRVFVNDFNEKINFTGQWEMAIVNMAYYPDENVTTPECKPKSIYILCDSIKSSYTPIGMANVLKRHYLTNEWESLSGSIAHPEYHRLSANCLSNIKIYITDAYFNLIQLTSGLLAVTLHFRKV